MKLGVVLPIFEDRVDAALHAASLAARAGLDGVFAYDHLWPMGRPDRPALAPFPILAAVAVAHPTLVVGPLVARVGLVDDAVLLAQFRSLEGLAPGRVIAALGTGDALSRAENEAYGLPYGSAEERRASLASCAAALQEEGIETWVGGGSPATMTLARALGATINCFSATPERVAEVAEGGPVSWAGTAAKSPEALAEQLHALSSAGATWAVCSYPIEAEALARAAETLAPPG